MLVLRLNKAGMPQEWVLPEEAARLYCQDKVLFELGATACTLHGGWNNAGIRSELTLSSIIACDGNVTDVSGKIALCNRYLFRRDDHLCLYCGQRFSPGQLTRDHIIPRSRGGQDKWTNVATACGRCNHAKGARTPEEANMRPFGRLSQHFHDLVPWRCHLNRDPARRRHGHQAGSGLSQSRR